MKSFYIVAAVILLGALSQPSMAQSRVIELGYEASPEMIRLPDSATGELTYQRCATCGVIRLRASAATRYVLGSEQVTLAEFAKYLERNPNAILVVSQKKDTSELTRVVVHNATFAQ
jgi:hypothetical protein